MTPKRPPKDCDVEAMRAWRRAYMQAYRRGEVSERKSAASQQGAADPHVRYRETGYYLDMPLLASLQCFAAQHGLSRRATIEAAVEKFFGHRRYKHEVRSTDAVFSDKKFLHDRLDRTCYDKLDEFTRDQGKFKRQLSISQVIEQAVRELVGLDVEYPYVVNAEPAESRHYRKRQRRGG